MPETAQAPTEDAPRKGPRLGIVVRLAIYIPLLAFFGWQASQKFRAENDAADEQLRARIQVELAEPQPTVVLPNGEVMPILQMSEEEAVKRGYISKPESESESE